MRKVAIEADVRNKAGKGIARQLRRAGKIPAVLYGAGGSVLLSLNPKSIVDILHGGRGENVLIALTVKGEKEKSERTAILRDFQADPVTGGLLHADFFEVSMDRAIRVKVPIEMTGETPAGVAEGGILQHVMREIEAEALPALIPEKILINAAHLKIGDSIRLSDVSVPSGVKVLGEAGRVVISVAAPISEEKLEKLLTAPAPGEVKEPELVRKEKKGEEEEGEETPEAASGGKGEAASGGKAEVKAEGKPEEKGKKQEEKGKKPEEKGKKHEEKAKKEDKRG